MAYDNRQPVSALTGKERSHCRNHSQKRRGVGAVLLSQPAKAVTLTGRRILKTNNAENENSRPFALGNSWLRNLVLAPSPPSLHALHGHGFGCSRIAFSASLRLCGRLPCFSPPLLHALHGDGVDCLRLALSASCHLCGDCPAFPLHVFMPFMVMGLIVCVLPSQHLVISAGTALVWVPRQSKTACLCALRGWLREKRISLSLGGL